MFDCFSSAIKLTMSLLLVMMSATWLLQHWFLVFQNYLCIFGEWQQTKRVNKIWNYLLKTICSHIAFHVKLLFCMGEVWIEYSIKFNHCIKLSDVHYFKLSLINFQGEHFCIHFTLLLWNCSHKQVLIMSSPIQNYYVSKVSTDLLYVIISFN